MNRSSFPKKPFWYVSLMVLALLVLAACQPAATATPPAPTTAAPAAAATQPQPRRLPQQQRLHTAVTETSCGRIRWISGRFDGR